MYLTEEEKKKIITPNKYTNKNRKMEKLQTLILTEIEALPTTIKNNRLLTQFGLQQ